jgi:HK97 family phage prohead protease
MTKRVSIDEIVAKRRASADDTGKLFKAVILDEAEEKAGYDPDKRAQRFIMSSERVDLYGDVVRQEGIKLDDFLKNPVALAYHKHSAPIGWWKDVTKINGRPKRTEGVLTLHAAGTTESVDEIDRLLTASAIKACSIGFMPIDAEWIVDDEGRNTWGLDFIESSMLECSVCSVPANPDALAKAAGGDMRLAAEMFERFLDTYCEKTAGGIVVRKDFEDAYLRMKEPKTIVETSTPEDTARTVITLELDTTEAERQAETFLAKWSKKFGEIFKAPIEEDPVIEPKAEPVLEIEPEPQAPALIAGSRQKALLASTRIKQSLRERGMLD